MRSPKNFKRERFALEIYAGKHPMDAMRIAGYKARPENARRMANSPDVRKRVGEMIEAERGYAEIEAMRARRERKIIAYADVANYFEPSLNADGKPSGRIKIKDFTTLPREFTAAIKTVKPTKLGWEITLHDKDSSLRAIEDRVDPKPASAPGVAVQVNVDNQVVSAQALTIMTDDELAELERLIEKAVAARSDQSGEVAPQG